MVKEQRLSGTLTGFTSSTLEGFVGETVEYEIIVENTGNVPLTFPSGLVDSHCDSGTIAGGRGTEAVQPGEDATYTCSHLLAQAGAYVNVAAITGLTPHGVEIPHESEPVEVKTGEIGLLAFRIEKLQQIAGSGAGFTGSPLTGTAGETVEYEIIVRNIGSAPATFTNFEDPNCAPGTLKGSPHEGAVAPGGEAVYTCSRVLSSPGTYDNVATVTGSGDGETVSHTSNTVEATVPAPPPAPPLPPSPPPPVIPKHEVEACTVSAPALRGANGPKRKPFTVSVASTNVKRITFYLDGRVLAKLTSASAKHGLFTVRINPAKLAIGAHRVSIKVGVTEAVCPPIARSSAFVHTRSPRVKPKFTG